MTLNVTTVALDGETSAGDTLLVQADKLSTAAGAQLQSGKNLSINARDARLAGTQAAQQTMVVNASKKLTHSGKSSAPSLNFSAPELTSSGVLAASVLNTQSQTLTNNRISDKKCFAVTVKCTNHVVTCCRDECLDADSGEINPVNSLAADTVMACKFFSTPVSRIAGMPDTAPSGAVFFIPSAIFTPLPDYAVTHRTARLTSALHTPPVPACASSRRESPFLSCH